MSSILSIQPIPSEVIEKKKIKFERNYNRCVICVCVSETLLLCTYLSYISLFVFLMLPLLWWIKIFILYYFLVAVARVWNALSLPSLSLSRCHIFLVTWCLLCESSYYKNLAIANRSRVSCINTNHSHNLATSRESRRYVVAYIRFADGGIWLRQKSRRHILASPGYAPGKIAVNVTWMERGFNACQTYRSMYPSIFNP